MNRHECASIIVSINLRSLSLIRKTFVKSADAGCTLDSAVAHFYKKVSTAVDTLQVLNGFFDRVRKLKRKRRFTLFRSVRMQLCKKCKRRFTLLTFS